MFFKTLIDLKYRLYRGGARYYIYYKYYIENPKIKYTLFYYIVMNLAKLYYIFAFLRGGTKFDGKKVWKLKFSAFRTITIFLMISKYFSLPRILKNYKPLNHH